MKKKVIIVLFLVLNIFFVKISFSQDNNYSWNDLVAWNGHNHWIDYFIMSPAYFGPNALPVAELKTARILDKPFFEILGEGHFMQGDNTANLYTRYYHPFFEGLIAVEFFIVPIEYYSLSSAIRDKRKVRNAVPKGFTGGDLTFGTTIQLVKDHDKYPDVVFGMYCRTASGEKLEDARYTDTPGYFFDVNFGKDIKNNSEYFDELRWFASIGFNAWQVGVDNYMQNDAGTAGIGFLVEHNNCQIQNHFAGYIGYLGMKNYPVVEDSEKPYNYNGDQPIVYRLIITKQIENMKLKFAYQLGLHDFEYNSFSFGLQYELRNNN